MSVDVMLASPSLDEQFSAHYVAWRRARLMAIRWYYGDAFFRGKSVLELGCGHGELGAALATLGAAVTCADAREEHIAVVRERWPGVRAVRVDLDHEWPFDRFDVVLHLGVLYHLEPTHESLRHSCRACSHLVLETEVCDSSDADLVHTPGESGYDQAYSGAGSRPSPARVERILVEEGMAFDRVSDDRCNAGMHVYDWPIEETGRYEDGLRRFWFARKERP